MRTHSMILSLAIFSALALTAWAASPGGGAAPAASSTKPATPFPSTPTAAGVTRMKLWAETPAVVTGPDADANPTEPTIDIYLPPADKAVGTAVLVLPGGGYTNLSMVNEGSSEAKFLVEHNIAAFVLRYRHAPRYRYPIPIVDGQRAMRVVRSNAAAWGINPDRIGIMGFSAGGHLAASVSTMFDNGPRLEAPYTPDAIDAISAKPNFSILMYPVIDFMDDAVTHKGSRTSLTQDNVALYEKLSPQKLITRDTPPAFIVHGTNDRVVPVANSILYYQALVKAGVPAEMHILENGPHGFGMGANSNDDTIKAWPEQALRWMGRHKLLTK